MYTLTDRANEFSGGIRLRRNRGTYWYACRVEPVANEASTNNQWSAKVQLNVKQPDLTVSALTISPTSSAPGHALTLSFKVSNIGSGDAPMVTATCYRSTDEAVDSTDTEIGTVDVAALATGSSADLSVQSTAPDTVGNYWYACRVEQVTNEASTNNQWSNTVSFEVIEPELVEPDLTVSNLALSSMLSEPGQALTLSFKVSNVVQEMPQQPQLPVTVPQMRL